MGYIVSYIGGTLCGQNLIWGKVSNLQRSSTNNISSPHSSERTHMYVYTHSVTDIPQVLRAQ